MTDDAATFRVVLTTVDSSELAESLAHSLVEQRLAACVNIVGPLRSVYRWQGEVVSEQERLLVIKTSARRLPALTEAIRDLHTYEVPEVLVLPVVAGDRPYLDWLARCLADKPAS
jgi:periplasmic divalent cation tolerance protein